MPPAPASKEDWARVALVRLRGAHAALAEAAGIVGTPRPLETVTHLVEAAEEALRQWLMIAYPPDSDYKP